MENKNESEQDYASILNVQDENASDSGTVDTAEPEDFTSGEWKGWVYKTVLFLTGQTFSLFGSSLVQFAIIWYITLTTKSGIMMTISTLSGFLPQLLISIFAGVWADRYPRKRLIIIADAGIAISTLALALFFWSGYRELWLLFLVSGIRSIGAGIQTPAVSAIIPQLVPTPKLMKVNGINNSINSFIMLISPVLSGALLATTSLETTFFIDVGTAIIAIAILLSLKIKTHGKALEELKPGYFFDLKEGLSYVRHHSLVKSILLFYAIFFFLLVPVALLTPLMVTRSFGPEVWKLTVNEVAFFAGSMLGGVAISIWGGFKKRSFTIVFSCIVFGVLTVAQGLSTIFFLYLGFMFLSGILVPFFSTAITVILQEKVEQDMQGRVFGFIEIVITAVMPIGMMLFGPLSDIVKVEHLLIVTGFLMAALGVVISFNRTIKTLE
jgi:DHA3 family macrolide efflux protein-like MFS transporter